MQTYEFSAKVTAEGKLELPEIYLENLPDDPVIRVVVMVANPSEPDEEELEFSSERFRQSWHEAMTGQVRPLSELWEGVDVE